MKKSTLLFATIVFSALMSTTMQSCQKEKDDTNDNIITQSINLSNLQTYYNGVLMENFSEDKYTPTRAANMPLTGIVVDTNRVYYFDQDLLFYEFCTSNQMEIIYETSNKLRTINRKAIELGLIEGEDETIPQAMADCWQETFGTSIHSSMQASRAVVVKLYDGYHWNGTSKTYPWPCKAKLGNMDNKTSSLELYLGAGATVMCYNNWFGGTRRWYWLVGGSAGFTLNNYADDNKYSSYFCVGI